MFDYKKMYINWDRITPDEKANLLKDNLQNLDNDFSDYLSRLAKVEGQMRELLAAKKAGGA